MRTKTLGDAGENAVTNYLQNKGYNILARNFRYGRFAEIDIIAEIGDTIVFVEVKTRRSNKFGMPAEAVTPQKQQKIITAATKFIQDNELYDRSCRFDVVEVFEINSDGNISYKINQIPNAFEVTS